MNGKSTCQALKAIRRDIAAENDIPLEIPECSYQGPCRGTCPRCESEVRYLERELAKRISMGKAVTIAGISASLMALGSACNRAGYGPLEGEPAIEDTTPVPSLVTGELVNASADGTVPKAGNPAETIELEGLPVPDGIERYEGEPAGD